EAERQAQVAAAARKAPPKAPAPVPAAKPAAAPAAAAPPAQDCEVLGLLDELAEPAPQELPMLPLADAAPPPWRQPAKPDEGSLLALPGTERAFKEATARGPRVGAKFQAASPDKGPPVAERMALDLAAVAEDAFANPQTSPEPAAPARREQLYGPYQLLEKVAVGGMAEVFKAKRSGVAGFEEVVAVKRILNHLSANKEVVNMVINRAKMGAGP